MTRGDKAFWVSLFVCLTLGAGINLPAVAPPADKTIYVSVSAYNISGIESDLATPLVYQYPPSQRSVTFAWDASTNAVGYRFYTGTNSGVYGKQIDVGNTTTFTLILIPPVTYYYAAYGQRSTNVGRTFSDMSTTPIARWTNIDGSGLGLPQEFYRLRVQQSTNAIP